VAETSQSEMSFWDHLDVLRGTLFRSVLVVALLSIVVFCFKSFVFDCIILAPAHSDFILYKLMRVDFEMKLINMDLAAQFFIHLKVSAVLAVVLGFPYLVYEIWKFIAPGLYDNEKSVVRRAFLFAGFLFYLGLLFGFYLVLPVCLNFFQGYTVSDAIENTISITSYISLFTSTVFMIGLVFEFPAVIAVLAKFGIVTKAMMKKYRRHAIIVVSCISAIVTPADPLSMIVVAIPLYMLYEMSIFLCKDKEDEDEPAKAVSESVESKKMIETKDEKPALEKHEDPAPDDDHEPDYFKYPEN